MFFDVLEADSPQHNHVGISNLVEAMDQIRGFAKATELLRIQHLHMITRKELKDDLHKSITSFGSKLDQHFNVHMSSLGFKLDEHFNVLVSNKLESMSKKLDEQFNVLVHDKLDALTAHVAAAGAGLASGPNVSKPSLTSKTFEHRNTKILQPSVGNETQRVGSSSLLLSAEPEIDYARLRPDDAGLVLQEHGNEPDSQHVKLQVQSEEHGAPSTKLQATGLNIDSPEPSAHQVGPSLCDEKTQIANLQAHDFHSQVHDETQIVEPRDDVPPQTLDDDPSHCRVPSSEPEIDRTKPELPISQLQVDSADLTLGRIQAHCAEFEAGTNSMESQADRSENSLQQLQADSADL